MAAAEQLHHMLSDLLGVLVGGVTAETSEALPQPITAEPEVAFGLTTDGDDFVAHTRQYVSFDFTFGGTLNTGVVSAA